MKKILVVLLILAVAGGVFAQQGSWSIGGSAEIGTRVNLDRDPDVDIKDDPVVAGGGSYWNWEQINAKASLVYTRDALSAGFNIHARNGENEVFAAYSGDNYQMQATFLTDILGDIGSYSSIWGGMVKRLWGDYGFFDGVLSVTVAYRSYDSGGDSVWSSDRSGSIYRRGGVLSGYATDENGNITGRDNYWSWQDGEFWGTAKTFTRHDGESFLRANANLGSLEFGIQVMNLFVDGNNTTVWRGPSPVGKEGDAALTPKPGSSVSNGGLKFVEDILKKSIIGAKFSQSPLEFAAQFMLENYGVYFGGKFFSGPVTIGLSFMGLLEGDGSLRDDDTYADPRQIGFGGDADYSGDGFGGGVTAYYDIVSSSRLDTKASVIGIEPRFFYNAIPSHLQFALNAGFYFANAESGSNKESATGWAVEPQLYWNFLGTGAGSYWSVGTGVCIRYRVGSADFRDLGLANNSVNFFDVAFKWNF